MKIKKQSMSKKILDIYSDYLICQNKYATATGLSDLLSGDISHDKITKYLNSEDLGSKELWLYIKPEIRKHELNKGGVLILDDSIEEKPYTDENEIVAWHHSYAKGMHVKGINILSCLVSYGDVVLPFGYALIRKDVSFSDIETGKVQRKSSMSKNQHFRNLIKQSTENKVLFEHILSDNWFGSKENMEFIESLGKKFIIGINSNRIIALSCKDKKLGKFQQISSLDMQDGESKKVWLKCVSFKVLLIKKVFINEDGSTGILYLASNDTEHDAAYLYKIYQKRWRIEEYHKSIKGSCIQYVDCCVYYRFLKSSYIATVEVKCRFCNQPEDVKKHGKCNMHQRYRFQQCRKTFQLDYLYRACNPGIKEQIVNLAMNNAGIRDTARALGVSINAVVRVLKNSRHALLQHCN